MHVNESHNEKDWRTCNACVKYFPLPHDYVWYGINGYNFTPLVDIPKGYLYTVECPRCHARICKGLESYGDGYGDLRCERCMAREGL